MEHRYDTVIIGAGPAGMACAVTMQHRGARLCVIDRAVFPRKKACAGLVTAKTYKLIKLLCGSKDINKLFCAKSSNVRLFRKSELLVEAPLENAVRLVDREVFDNALVNTYKALGGTIIEGVGVIHIDYENNRINMPSNLRVGDNMYCDENHDGQLNEDDLIYLGSSEPEISYSFNLGAAWKGIDINIVFQGAANRFIYRGYDTNWVAPYRGLYVNNLRSSIGNTWTPDNPNAYYAPYTNDRNLIEYNYQASSLTAQDGRYLRLKNITIGYTFPKTLLNKIGFIEGLRVYFTGTDLFETTKIQDGWDPESKIAKSGTALYPFTRNYTFGLNVTF